jgi:hypothetical protein
MFGRVYSLINNLLNNIMPIDITTDIYNRD